MGIKQRRAYQVVAIHQEVKPDIPVSGVYFYQHLALPEVSTGFGCVRDTKTEAE
ncbi:MAG: hypothetical protein IID59_10695 [Proteobacteria bacterium]|nr:hypothetical protein [Pseudomonadota bacterium]